MFLSKHIKQVIKSKSTNLLLNSNFILRIHKVILVTPPFRLSYNLTGS